MSETIEPKVQLDHERLDVFAVAVELDGVVVALVRLAPRGHAWLGDQAQRASASVVLNLAEALGREGSDRARMLRISKGSALELDAALTLLANRGACAKTTREKARSLTLRVVAMLTRLRERAVGWSTTNTSATAAAAASTRTRR